MAETKIGGVEYRVETLLARDAVALQMRVMRILGPAMNAMPEVLSTYFKGQEGRQLANQKALAAIGDIVAKSDPAEATQLVVDVCELAESRRPSGDYEKVSFDQEFSGKLMDAYKLMAFVLQAQFGELFQGVPANGSPAGTPKG